MRDIRAALAAAAMLLLPAATPAAAAPADDGVWTTITVAAPRYHAARQAPADEYFGAERLSNLGIRNAIHDMDLEGTSPLALPIQLGRIRAVEDALAVWADRYPSDSWLPGTTLSFAKFLRSKGQAFTDDLALGYLIFLAARYPSTGPGFEARELLGGYHPMPAFDMADATAQGRSGVGASLFPKTRR